jgi:hypothetical protein
MWLIPVLTLCLAATAVFDLVVALFGFARTEFFWPSAFCASLGGLSAVMMAIVFLDFDASAALYTALAALGGASLLSLFPAIRSMA